MVRWGPRESRGREPEQIHGRNSSEVCRKTIEGHWQCGHGVVHASSAGVGSQYERHKGELTPKILETGGTCHLLRFDREREWKGGENGGEEGGTYGSWSGGHSYCCNLHHVHRELVPPATVRQLPYLGDGWSEISYGLLLLEPQRFFPNDRHRRRSFSGPVRAGGNVLEINPETRRMEIDQVRPSLNEPYHPINAAIPLSCGGTSER